MTAATLEPTLSLETGIVVDDPETGRHYLYLLCFQNHPYAFKVGISDPLVQRVRGLATTYGLLDLARCVTVSATSRRETELFERYVHILYEKSRYEWTQEHLKVAGHLEWLCVASYADVLDTIAGWVHRRSAYCRLVPAAEVLGRAGQEKLPQFITPFVSATERRRGAQARRRARDAARHALNRANLAANCQAIEANMAYLRKVQLWQDNLHHRVEGRLLFICGSHGVEVEQPAEAPGGLLLAGLAAHLQAHRAIVVPPKVSWTRRFALTRGSKILVPYVGGGRHGLIVRVRIHLCSLDARYIRHTPEMDIWVSWLMGLRNRAGGRRITPNG